MRFLRYLSTKISFFVLAELQPLDIPYNQFIVLAYQFGAFTF